VFIRDNEEADDIIIFIIIFLSFQKDGIITITFIFFNIEKDGFKK
jgi:hypothetical protein